jgi:hypothetical protein
MEGLEMKTSQNKKKSLDLLWFLMMFFHNSHASEIGPSPLPGPSASPSTTPTSPKTIPVAATFYPIEDKIPGAKESYYSDKIFNVLANWPPKYIPASEGANPIWVRGIRTKDKPNYIGLVKRVLIKAPLERIAKLIEEIEKNKEIFPEIIQVKVTSQDQNRIWTAWERESPSFLIPNIKYEQAYVMDTRSPDKKIYRYQLVSGNSVNNSDGIIVIERIGSFTRLIAWDFFDANWGLARTLAEGLIWKKALEGSFKGDASFLYKAENPEWNRSQIEDATSSLLDKFPVDPVQFLDNFSLER